MDKNMLNEVYEELYDVIGEDAMLRGYNLFRGQQITFPVRLYDSQQIRKIIAIVEINVLQICLLE